MNYKLEELKKIKPGQWLFTCTLEPRRFSEWDIPKREWYSPMSDEKWEEIEYNDFSTMEGSSHSAMHCGMDLISDKYAEWFNKNKCWELFRDDWEEYEKKIKELCVKDNVEYEGY